MPSITESHVPVQTGTPDFFMAAPTLGSSWEADEVALLRLWREKRGEAEPEDLSAISLSSSAGSPRTSTGTGMSATPRQAVKDVQRRVQHPLVRWMAATLDGRVEGHGGGV